MYPIRSAGLFAAGIVTVALVAVLAGGLVAGATPDAGAGTPGNDPGAPADSWGCEVRIQGLGGLFESPVAIPVPCPEEIESDDSIDRESETHVSVSNRHVSRVSQSSDGETTSRVESRQVSWSVTRQSTDGTTEVRCERRSNRTVVRSNATGVHRDRQTSRETGETLTECADIRPDDEAVDDPVDPDPADPMPARTETE